MPYICRKKEFCICPMSYFDITSFYNSQELIHHTVLTSFQFNFISVTYHTNYTWDLVAQRLNDSCTRSSNNNKGLTNTPTFSKAKVEKGEEKSSRWNAYKSGALFILFFVFLFSSFIHMWYDIFFRKSSSINHLMCLLCIYFYAFFFFTNRKIHVPPLHYHYLHVIGGDKRRKTSKKSCRLKNPSTIEHFLLFFVFYILNTV